MDRREEEFAQYMARREWRIVRDIADAERDMERRQRELARMRTELKQHRALLNVPAEEK